MRDVRRLAVFTELTFDMLRSSAHYIHTRLRGSCELWPGKLDERIGEAQKFPDIGPRSLHRKFGLACSISSHMCPEYTQSQSQSTTGSFRKTTQTKRTR